MTRIIVLDDDQKIRNLFADFLMHQGFRVFPAADADAANEILKKEEIDVLLLDIKMPQVTGVDMGEVMQLFHADAKVIVASVLPEDEQRHLVPGADDYFDKSDAMSVLLDKIRGVLGRAVSSRRSSGGLS